MSDEQVIAVPVLKATKTLCCILCRGQLDVAADASSAVCPKDDCIVSDAGTLFASTFLLEQELGSGGWGTVYKCTHVNLKKTLAIKILHSHLIRDKNTLLRFQREARIMTSLNHQNIVAIVDHGWSPQPFIAMEFLEGKPLSSILASARPDTGTAVRYLLEIAKALEVAHQAGVIHRDLKPANVFITDAGEVKVLDFGVAKVSETTLTATGETFGSPGFMSPEQCMGDPLDARSDVYAFGCVMYELLTGKAAFKAANALELIRLQLMEMPPSFQVASPDNHISTDLEQITFCCLAKEADARYESMAEVLAALASADLERTVSTAVTSIPVPPTWPGTVHGAIVLLCAVASTWTENPGIIAGSLLLALLSTVLAMCYFVICVHLQREVIKKAGYKPKFGSALSSLILFATPTLGLLCCVIAQYLLPVLWIWGGFCSTLLTALVGVAFFDFHAFIAKRQGRKFVPGIVLLLTTISVLYAVPTFILFFLPADSYSTLLRIVIAGMSWVGAIHLLGVLNEYLKNTVDEAYEPQVNSKRFVIAAVASLMAVSILAAQKSFWNSEDQLQAAVLNSFEARRENAAYAALTTARKHSDYVKEQQQLQILSELRHRSDYGTESALGWAAVANGKPQEAIEPFERAIALAPYKHYSYAGAAVAAALRGDTKAARSIAALAKGKCMDMWPLPALQFLSGEISREQMFEEVPPLNRELSAEADFYSGVGYLLNHDKQKAFGEFQKVLDSGCDTLSEYSVASGLLHPNVTVKDAEE